ncbi:high-temperature-induced dauer-formation protein-domain-containing protein [Thamnidium elegans]|nr:high-temperature-induced dauer-formation protein-domain-containing protein [Thamnidium elegans]
MGAADSKLAFRKGVFRLFEDKSISVTDNDFWELFWELPESADDIFSLIGANDIRRTRDTARENFEILIDKVLEKMSSILKSKNFPSEQHSINHLLNCCRIMTRIMPFVFESTDILDWEETFFWTPRQVEKPTKTSDNKPEYEILPCRGEFLLTLTIESLFLAGFTIPISLATSDSKIVYAIWENGVGSSIPISSYKDNESNRTEVLRLLAVLLSKSMYVPPAQLLSKEDLWLRHVAVKTERKVVLVMLCSLMNTICNYDPTGWVPYNHVVNGGPREQLVSFCLTNLLILLDYRSPHQADLMRQYDHDVAASVATHDLTTEIEVISLDSSNPVPKTSVELEVFTPEDGHQKSEENVFRYYMSKLHRKQDFEFLMNGIHRLLINPMTAVNTYLPGSTKRVGCYIDVMMMCWRLIETNSRFTKYLVETDRVLDLTVALIFHAIDNKDKLSQIGLVRMCAFMLQTLSSNKDFSAKLNTHFATHSSLPSSIRLYAFNGTYADFLIISIFSLIATTHGTLSTLYPSLILTICNISPYLTNLGVTTASKLLTLFNSMSSPQFLMADEYNLQLTGYVLEIFNNIIHYQFKDNPNLIYSIVLHHDYFERLNNLTFAEAVDQVERIRVIREAKTEAVIAEPTNSTEPADSTEPTTEPTKTDSIEPSKIDPVETMKTESIEPTKTESVEPANTEEPSTQESSVQESSTQHQAESEPDTNSADKTNAIRQDSVLRTRNGFMPTESWLTFWKQKLPLDSILRLVKYLVPKVEEKCVDNNTSLEEIIEFLKTVDINEILDLQSQQTFIRKFQWGEALVIWFRSMMWGQNYVSSMKEYGAWNGTHVKLFQIKEQ